MCVQSSSRLAHIKIFIGYENLNCKKKSEICASSVTNYGVYTLGLVYFLINPYASEENREEKKNK